MTTAEDLPNAELQEWIGREYWPYPKDLPPEPVRALDVARYTAALADHRWSSVHPGYAPPGFMEVNSPNYLNYFRLGGEEFLHRLLPFVTPWGEGWTPMMLVRNERWTVDRLIRVGEVVRGRSIITDIRWRESSDGRPAQLSVEFTKEYLSMSGGDRVGCVVWDMVFVGDPLKAVDEERETAPQAPDLTSARLPNGAEVGTAVGRYTRTMDMEAIIRWSAAVYDMGLPHVDPDYARRVYGTRHAVVHGPFVSACLVRLVTDWMGPEDRVVGHHARFRLPVLGNDRLEFAARLDSVSESEHGQNAALVSTATNQFGDVVASAETRCVLAGA